MEFEIRPEDSETRSYRVSMVMLAILIAILVILQVVGGIHGNRARSDKEDSVKDAYLKTGDFYVKCYLAFNSDQFKNLTFGSYKKALPWPSAYRSLGVLEQSLGKSGLSDFAKIDSPKTIRSLDLDKSEIIKLHREKEMWLNIYSSKPLAIKEARRYAAEVRKLNLGPLKEIAVADVYLHAGWHRTANKIVNEAKTSAKLSLIAGSFLLCLLIFGGLVGVVIVTIYLASLSKQEINQTQQNLSPSILIRAFIVYLSSFLVLSGAGEFLSEITRVPSIEKWSGTAYMGFLIVVSLMAYAIGLSTLVPRSLNMEQDWKAIGYRISGFKEKVLLGLAGFSASLPLVAVFYILSNVIFKNFQTPKQPFGDIISQGSILETALVFFAASVMAPIIEETFFRGVLYTAFRGKMGVWPSVFISSAVFASIHPLPGGFLPIFSLACVLAMVREKSGSLIPGMVCHSLYNTVGLLISIWLF